jgi:hypothetical protein
VSSIFLVRIVSVDRLRMEQRGPPSYSTLYYGSWASEGATPIAFPEASAPPEDVPCAESGPANAGPDSACRMHNGYEPGFPTFPRAMYVYGTVRGSHPPAMLSPFSTLPSSFRYAPHTEHSETHPHTSSAPHLIPIHPINIQVEDPRSESSSCFGFYAGLTLSFFMTPLLASVALPCIARASLRRGYIQGIATMWFLWGCLLSVVGITVVALGDISGSVLFTQAILMLVVGVLCLGTACYLFLLAWRYRRFEELIVAHSGHIKGNDHGSHSPAPWTHPNLVILTQHPR